jgi:hypothetical protein
MIGSAGLRRRCGSFALHVSAPAELPPALVLRKFAQLKTFECRVSILSHRRPILSLRQLPYREKLTFPSVALPRKTIEMQSNTGLA